MLHTYRLAVPFLLLGVLDGAGPTRTPLVRVVDLSIGEERPVELCDGSRVSVRLAGVEEIRDPVRDAVRSARATVEVDGVRAVLTSSTYHLPVTVGTARVDCPVTKGYLSNATQDAWGLVEDARLRLWPAASPAIDPATFACPVVQAWFASDTQMANEPTFVDGGERPAC